MGDFGRGSEISLRVRSLLRMGEKQTRDSHPSSWPQGRAPSYALFDAILYRTALDTWFGSKGSASCRRGYLRRIRTPNDPFDRSVLSRRRVTRHASPSRLPADYSCQLTSCIHTAMGWPSVFGVQVQTLLPSASTDSSAVWKRRDCGFESGFFFFRLRFGASPNASPSCTMADRMDVEDSCQPYENARNQKLRRRRDPKTPFAETRPSLCNEGLIPGALLLGEPAEPHQGKYGEEKGERKEEGGRLFMGALREGKMWRRHGGSLGADNRRRKVGVVAGTGFWS